MTAMASSLSSLWHGHWHGSAVGTWCVRQLQRQALTLLGACLGAALLMWAFSEVWDAHDEAGQKLAAVQAQWSAQGAVVTVPEALDPLAQGAGLLWRRLPGRWPPDSAASLRQFLIGQRLQVVALRVLPDVVAGPLKGQSLAVRMMGAYANWTRAWQILSTSGPVMSIERMSVLSLAQPSGEQIEVVLNLWSMPGSTGDVSWPSDNPLAPVAASGADIFALVTGVDWPPVAAEAKAKEPIVQTDDPLTWPMERIRWLGSWQQGADPQAVLSAGGAWIAVRVGQRVSLEGHKVAAIVPDGLVLRTPQGQRVELKGGSR